MFFEDFRNATNNGLDDDDDDDYPGLQDGIFGDADDQKGSSSSKETTGRWTREEHLMFVKGLEMYGKGWKKIAGLIKTRTVVQIRTHAQKYFLKLSKARQHVDSNGSTSVDGKVPSSGSRKRIKRREGDQIGLSVALQPFIKKASGDDKTIDVDECLFNFLSPKLPSSTTTTSSATPNFLSSSSGLNFSGGTQMKTFDEMLSQNIFDGNRHALNTDAKQGYISSSSGIAEDVSNSSVDRMETNASVGDLPPRQRVVVETPLWFRQGADLESLLHRADSLDWLADSGVPVKVDEPTTTNSSDIVVISESKHKPAAIGAVGIIPSSNAQYCPPPHAMLPPVSYHAQSTYSHIPFQNQPAYIPNGHNGNAPVAVLERPHAGLQHCASSSSVSSPHAGYGDIQNQASGQYQYTTISPRQEQIFNEYPQPYIQNSIPIVGEHSMLPIPMHQPMYNVLSSSGSGAVPNYSQQSQKSFNQQQCFQYQQLPRPQLSEVQYQPHLPQKLPQHPLSTSNGYSTYVNPSGNTAVMMNDQSMPPPVSILPISSPLVPLQQLDTESELKAHLLGLSDDEGEEAHTQYKLVPSMVDQKNISSTPTVPVFDGGIAVDSQSKIDQIMVKIESGIASGVANKKHNNLSDHTEPTLDVSDGPSLSSHDSPVSVDSIASSLDQRKISNTKLTL